MKELLVIGHTYPEPSTTAAGQRMMQLIDLLEEAGYKVTFASAAEPTDKSVDLKVQNIRIEEVRMNDSSFDDFVKALNPDVVLFDRFMTEEQFGWRVAEVCPHALRLLDTEDLHFLRKARREAHERGTAISEGLYSDLTKRELASILRSDMSLIISSAEMNLLKGVFNIPEGLLYEIPLFYKALRDTPSFDERSHFVTIGNFMHTPKTDSIYYLKESIWPLIREKLPTAQLRIYGAYASKEIQQLHDEAEGFLIKGWAPDVTTIMKSAKVCLAPLRFGAGLKGKVLDALSCGTPVVTTAFGAEGIDKGNGFPGKVAETPQELAKAAIRLYSEENTWKDVQSQALKTIEDNYDRETYSQSFIERIEALRETLQNHRKQHFLGQILQHEFLNSKKFMSKWIETKNTLKQNS